MIETGRTWKAWIAVVLLALGAHALGLGGTWHYDDVHTIVQNPHLDDPRVLGQLFRDPAFTSSDAGGGMYRPLLFVSFTLNNLVFGRSAFGFLLVNWLLHAAATACAFGLALELARRAGRDAGHARRVATVVGCVFAVHPVLVETVHYVSARSSGLATFLALASVWAALRASAGPKLRWDLAVASWLAAAGACLTKEIAATLPLLFLVTAIPTGGLRRGARSSTALLCTGLFVVVGTWLWVRGVVVGGGSLPSFGGEAGGADAFRGGGRSAWINLLTQVVVVTRYLGLLAWPAGLSIDHEARIVTSFGDPIFLACFGLLATLTVLALSSPRRRPLVAAGWLWFAIALGPTSSILPLNVLMNEHRLYLPVFGVLLAFAELAVQWLESARTVDAVPADSSAIRGPRRLALVLATAALLAFGARGLVRQLDWWSAERIWETAIEVSPGSPTAHLGLGNELAARGEMTGACAAFERALRLDPGNDAARINAAECYLRRWEQASDRSALERAREHLLEVSEHRPDSNLVALKTARMHHLRYLAEGREEDRRGCDDRLRSILEREPAHAAAQDARRRFAQERAASEGLPR